MKHLIFFLFFYNSLFFSYERDAAEARKDVEFLLWTKENPDIPDKLYIGNMTALKLSHFDKDLPSKILIHGFEDTGTTGWIYNVKDAYFFKGMYSDSNLNIPSSCQNVSFDQNQNSNIVF